MHSATFPQDQVQSNMNHFPYHKQHVKDMRKQVQVWLLKASWNQRICYLPRGTALLLPVVVVLPHCTLSSFST